MFQGHRRRGYEAAGAAAAASSPIFLVLSPSVSLLPAVADGSRNAVEAIALPLGLPSSSSVNQSLPQSLLSALFCPPSPFFLYSVHPFPPMKRSARAQAGAKGRRGDPGCWQSPKKMTTGRENHWSQQAGRQVSERDAELFFFPA